jgi:Tfp pilus assembly protein PilP
VSVSADARNQRAKGEGGASGMSVSEISVRGVLQSRGKLVAMVMGPDNKTYIVHQGDKLADGSIKLITPQGLVIEQEVNDPLSVVKQREIRKLLRGLEDAK